MKENALKEKSFVFAVMIVNCYKNLVDLKKEYVLTKQILRSGTSVGAMIREAQHAESKNDFIHKLSIAQKEINETINWLELLSSTEYISKEIFEDLNDKSTELIKLLTSSIKTAKTTL